MLLLDGIKVVVKCIQQYGGTIEFSGWIERRRRTNQMMEQTQFLVGLSG